MRKSYTQQLLFGVLCASAVFSCSIDPVEQQLRQESTPVKENWKVITLKNGKSMALKIIPGGYLLDDIAIGEQEIEYLQKGAPAGRTGVWDKKWNDGIIYYVFDGNLAQWEQNNIRSAMNEWESLTGSRIVFAINTNTTTHPDYIRFRKDNASNNSRVGRVGGVQDVNLFNTNSFRVLRHEIGHALGLLHEHTRADRDNYVDINYSNIQCDYLVTWPGGSYCSNEEQFWRYNQYWWYSENGFDLGTFDFQSVMLYGSRSFSNGLGPTITRKDGSEFNAPESISAGDVETMNFMYSGVRTRPYFARMESVEYDRDEPYDYSYFRSKTRLTVKFYADRNFTQPISVDGGVRVHYWRSETRDNYTSWSKVLVDIPAGVSQYDVGELSSECNYNASHDPMPGCYSQSAGLDYGLGYKLQ